MVRLLLATVLAGGCALVEGQSTSDEVFRVYTEAPRLLLRAQRLRLLKRESERKSMRWEQFHALMAGAARMPEQGFAKGLEAAVTGDAAATRTALEWAAGPGGSARQVALIYDWLRGGASPAQAKAIEGKLRTATQAATGSLDAARDRAFAALALADVDADLAERTLRDVVTQWWRKDTAPRLEAGTLAYAGRDLYPLFELLHAVRDNLNIDLRENAVAFFKPLPGLFLLGHYPAPFPAAENDYRVPAFRGPGEPDLDAAVLTRAAGLSIVAYDNNSTDCQFLQGWLLMDHYLLRGAFGIPYEYLWANPYQPGLSYYHFPLGFHDPASGRLFLRASWEDDAAWFGIVDGQMQLFADGKITIVNPKLKQPPQEFGPSLLVLGAEAANFPVETEKAGTVYVAGLDSKARYNIEVDDEEMWDATSDPAGTIEIPVPAGLRGAIRVTRAR